MAAIIANETGKRELIKPYKTHAEQAPRSFAIGARVIAGMARHYGEPENFNISSKYSVSSWISTNMQSAANILR
jgi:hypothetical protein